ncbi:hypothetical protein PV11_06180 [Exophiala sideris]|uniref:Uncharacterized protein n=1 Tax=Exophiala sideris TaxID=1016849 RepID=A0A0D1VR94_9EURO|nr:hypothetical protein PV11_06180 [Exophiala sideris]
MSLQYIINITNNSGNPQTYCLFAAPPSITSSGSKVDIVRFVIVGTETVLDGVTTIIQFPQTILAVCGTRKLTTDALKDVKTFSAKPITLSTNDTPGTHADGFMLGFGTRLETRTGYYAMFTPHPLETYQIQPGLEYVVAVGSVATGSPVIDQQLLNTCGVSFNSTQTVGVVHLSDGKLVLS